MKTTGRGRSTYDVSCWCLIQALLLLLVQMVCMAEHWHLHALAAALRTSIVWVGNVKAPKEGGLHVR